MRIRNPDPQTHLQISLVKSVVRVFAGISLATGSLVTAGILFVIAECLGIAEELF